MVQVNREEANGFSMEYCRFGTGENTLVILPGLSVQSVMPSAEAIAQAYRAMTDDYTVYVFDRRGGILPETYCIGDMAEDTAKVVQQLGLQNIHLFGASQGGMIAMELAARYPQLVNKLIIGSSSSCIGGEQSDLFNEWIALAKESKATELYLAMGGALYPENVFAGLKAAFAEAAKTVTAGELARFVVLASSLVDTDISADLAKITCPVLVIGSRDDRVLGGPASERIAKEVKNSGYSDLYMYDGFGHAVYDLAPDYQERMLAFLRKDEQGL